MAESYNLHPHSPLWDLGRYLEISGFIYTYYNEPSPAGEDWSEEAVPVVVQELEVEAVGDLGLGHGDPAPVLGVEHSVRVLRDRRHPDTGLQHPQQRGLYLAVCNGVDTRHIAAAWVTDKRTFATLWRGSMYWWCSGLKCGYTLIVSIVAAALITGNTSHSSTLYEN